MIKVPSFLLPWWVFLENLLKVFQILYLLYYLFIKSYCDSTLMKWIGASLAPVYTYPEHRRKGYATAAVAELSAYCLNVLQKEYVTLYTDLDNPTPNSIYQKIGFVPEVK